MHNQSVVFLNLPHNEQITRRYMCSYASPESLMPPLELISCAAIARDWNSCNSVLIDAIADKLTLTDSISQIKAVAPAVIVSLTGFECYEDDVNTVKKLKAAFPEVAIVLFGHYATNFPEESLRNSNADFIILGEPETVLSNLLAALSEKQSIASVTGICMILDGKFVKQGDSSRIRDPTELPIPAYDLLPIHKYGEPLLAQPYGMIQTIRGCPYQCSYCVKSYGSKLSQLSTDRVIKEMKLWIELQGVKSIRFIDDTFTINRVRVIELCKAIIENKLNVEWACLSRTDNLDEELLNWMKKAGCKRIYFGMESGSQRMLDIYKKNVDVGEALKALLLCRKVGIETAAFFMSGHPEETENDFVATLEFAKSANLNYASFNPLTPYPGTSLYVELKEYLTFNIYPYKNEWTNPLVNELFDQRKQRFYRGFYLRYGYIVSNFRTNLKNILQLISMGVSLLRYLWWDKQFVISGLKGAKDK